MHLKHTSKQYNKTLQEYEQLAQIIDSGVDELQETNVDTDIAVSTHDGNVDETMEIPYPGKYDYYDPDRPSSQCYKILEQLGTMKDLCLLRVFKLHSIT